jgi:hypothetical protein
MPWEPLQLLNRSGQPLKQDEREIILKGIEKALDSPDVDIGTLLRAANNIGAQVGCIRDLPKYTEYSFFRVVKQAKIMRKKEDDRFEELGPHHLRRLAQHRRSDPVEDQILIGELLEDLNGLDKEIYLRRLSGDSFERIDNELSLKPRTSEYRYREAKRRLRRRS